MTHERHSDIGFMNPDFDLYLFKELVACYSFPSNYIDIYIQLLAF